MIFETVENVDHEALRALANDAFSDYVVPVPPMSAEMVDEMFLQRGFTPRHSWVAREDDELAAYWFVGTENDRPGLSYGLSVGTRPAFRRRGLSAALWQRVAAALKQDGFVSQTLEVIETNTRAIPLYERLGFHAARRIACFKGPAPAPQEGALRFQSTSVDEAINIGAPFGNWNPTWQNANPAVRNVKASMAATLVFEGSSPVAYGLLHIPYGQVAQIAVAPDYRQRGIARALLSHWGQAHHLDAMAALNVPDTDRASLGFFKALGWENHINQIEMTIDL